MQRYVRLTHGLWLLLRVTLNIQALPLSHFLRLSRCYSTPPTRLESVKLRGNYSEAAEFKQG
jgi:hypothetical protein